MIRLHGHAVFVLKAICHPVGRHNNDGILGQGQRLVVDATVGCTAHQMRVGGPKAVRDYGTVVCQHGVKTPSIPCHYIGDGHPNAAHQPHLIRTRVESPCRGHSA